MTTAPAQSVSTTAMDGPPDPELVRIRDLVYQVAGIFHPDNKLRLLLDRCSRRMKELKAQSLRNSSRIDGRRERWRPTRFMKASVSALC